jgi:hypothetical protein
MAILLTISNNLSSHLAPEKYSMSSQAVKASLWLAPLGLDPLALLPADREAGDGERSGVSALAQEAVCLGQP